MTSTRRCVDSGPVVTDAPIEKEPSADIHCDACGEAIEGTPAGAGLFLWTRGDEVRYEEPPLCERCAYAIAVGGMLQWELDEEG